MCPVLYHHLISVVIPPNYHYHHHHHPPPSSHLSSPQATLCLQQALKQSETTVKTNVSNTVWSHESPSTQTVILHVHTHMMWNYQWSNIDLQHSVYDYNRLYKTFTPIAAGWNSIHPSTTGVVVAMATTRDIMAINYDIVFMSYNARSAKLQIDWRKSPVMIA